MECSVCKGKVEKYNVTSNIAIYSETKTRPNGGEYQEGVGPLEVYVCKDCGHVDWYVRKDK